MRFTLILIVLVLLPVMMGIHLWDLTENHQPRWEAEARQILQDHGVRGGTVDVRFLDLSVTGDAPDKTSLEEASQALASVGPLRLVSNRLSILAKIHARLEKSSLTLSGWLPDQDTVDSLRGLLRKLRPDLEIVTTDLKLSTLVRWPEGEKLPLAENSLMLKPILSALHVPPALEIVRREGRLVASGMLPEQELKEAIQAALQSGSHGLGVDVDQLRVSSHVTSAAFVEGMAMVPFLKSFYATPSPGEFSIQPGQNPRLKADTTRTLESAWLGHLRAVTRGTKVDMQLTLHPSVYHFPGRRTETALPEDVLQGVRDLISGEYILFSPGSTSLSTEEKARLSGLIPALLAAGPALRLIVGGHPEPGGEMRTESQLALRRAEQVVSFLIEQGAPAAEIRALAFDPVPLGEPSAPAQTRSVEILIQ